MDDVFKIHGRRLSIQLIEKKWEDHLQTKALCILNEDKKLLAFIKTNERPENLFEKLMTHIPFHMVPFLILAEDEEPPLSYNGKVDKKSLKDKVCDTFLKIIWYIDKLNIICSKF